MAVPTNQQILDAIKTELLARIEGTSIPDYSVEGRSLRKMSDQVLQALEERYTKLAEKDAVSASSGGLVSFAQFGRPA